MSTGMTIAFGCYGLVSLVSMLFGVMYLSRSSFMPYHAATVGKSWAELDSRMQILLLGMLRVAGAGLLTSGLTTAVLLLLPFRAGESWARWAIPALGLVMIGTVINVLWRLRKETGAKPPLPLALGCAVLLIAGVAASQLG